MNISDPLRSYITMQFVPNVINYFESAIKVIPYSSTISVTAGSTCGNYTFATSVNSSAHLYIFVTYSNDSSTPTVAWARACFLSNYNNRFPT